MEAFDGRKDAAMDADGQRPDIEREARRMLLALDALISVGAQEADLTEKHRTRVAFALERAAELRASADAEGGAFAPARVEVALSILQSQVEIAVAFVNRTLRQARRAPGRRTLRAAVDDAISSLEGRERRAA